MLRRRPPRKSQVAQKATLAPDTVLCALSHGTLEDKKYGLELWVSTPTRPKREVPLFAKMPTRRSPCAPPPPCTLLLRGSPHIDPTLTAQHLDALRARSEAPHPPPLHALPAGGDAAPLPNQLAPAHAAPERVACPALDLTASCVPPRLRQHHKHEHHLMLI